MKTRKIIKRYDEVNQQYIADVLTIYDNSIKLQRLSTPIFTDNPKGLYRKAGGCVWYGKTMIKELYQYIS